MDALLHAHAICKALNHKRPARPGSALISYCADCADFAPFDRLLQVSDAVHSDQQLLGILDGHCGDGGLSINLPSALEPLMASQHTLDGQLSPIVALHGFSVDTPMHPASQLLQPITSQVPCLCLLMSAVSRMPERVATQTATALLPWYVFVILPKAGRAWVLWQVHGLVWSALSHNSCSRSLAGLDAGSCVKDSAMLIAARGRQLGFSTTTASNGCQGLTSGRFSALVHRCGMLLQGKRVHAWLGFGNIEPNGHLHRFAFRDRVGMGRSLFVARPFPYARLMSLRLCAG